MGDKVYVVTKELFYPGYGYSPGLTKEEVKLVTKDKNKAESYTKEIYGRLHSCTLEVIKYFKIETVNKEVKNEKNRN